MTKSQTNFTPEEVDDLLDEIRNTDISVICYYLKQNTHFDGDRLKKYWKWMIERLVYVEEQLDSFQIANKGLHERRQHYRNQLKQCKQALAFYANKDNYTTPINGNTPPILHDSGKTARQLLNELTTSYNKKSVGTVVCEVCGGSGFETPGTDYDNVCDECGGHGEYPK